MPPPEPPADLDAEDRAFLDWWTGEDTAGRERPAVARGRVNTDGWDIGEAGA